MPRKKYSPKFKSEAAEFVRSSSASASAVARDLGLSPAMLNHLSREAERSSKSVFQGTGRPHDQELGRPKRELAQVKEERDFLRDAATYFAKGGKGVIAPGQAWRRGK